MKKVRDAVTHWEGFFANNEKYHKVGMVKREADWLAKLPRRELCDAAKAQRPKRDEKMGS